MKTVPWWVPIAALVVSIIAVFISYASYRNARKSRQQAEKEYEARGRLASVLCVEGVIWQGFTEPVPALGLIAKNGLDEVTVTNAHLHIEFAHYWRGLVRVYKYTEHVDVHHTSFPLLNIAGPNLEISPRLAPNHQFTWEIPSSQVPDKCSVELVFDVETTSGIESSNLYQVPGSYNPPRWLTVEKGASFLLVSTRAHLVKLSAEFREWVDIRLAFGRSSPGLYVYKTRR